MFVGVGVGVVQEKGFETKGGIRDVFDTKEEEGLELGRIAMKEIWF